MNLKNLVKGQNCADVGELTDKVIAHLQGDPSPCLVICSDCGHEETMAEPDAYMACSECGGEAMGAEMLLLSIGGLI